MAGVVLKNISKIFNNKIKAVDNMNLDIKDKEFLVLVGPSGCGKSTTLRMIAGLEEPTSGDIYIDGELVNDVLPKNRDVAMVFQNYALYPHMSVYNNIAFGLKLRHYPKEEIDRRIKETTTILGISDLLDRKPKELSGGQSQRVALGRAIVRKPKVFLFDEPLSNLDAKFRVQMRTEIKKLHMRLQTTIIYVTHDQIEATTMGDRIVVLKDGIIQQVDTPINIFDSPLNKFTAGFIGSPSMNFMEGTIIKKEDGFYFDEGSFQVRFIDDMIPKIQNWIDKKVIFGIRPTAIYDKLFVSTATRNNIVTVTIETIEPIGAEKYLYVTTKLNTFIVQVDVHTQAEVNQEIELVFDMNKIHLFDINTERAII